MGRLRALSGNSTEVDTRRNFDFAGLAAIVVQRLSEPLDSLVRENKAALAYLAQ